MSLNAALSIGRSGIIASQVGIQVTGHNMANATTAGYSRQVVQLRDITAARSDSQQLGRGVAVESVARQVDEAITTRLRSGISDEHAADSDFQTLRQLESLLGELSDFDLSTRLNEFFETWSDAANLIGAGTVLVEEGARIAEHLSSRREDISRLRTQIDDAITSNVDRANTIIGDIASLNSQISVSEGVGTTANGLRDQRDRLLAELSQIVDITAVENTQLGTVDVLIGSAPVVLGARARPIEVAYEGSGSDLTIGIAVASDGTPLDVEAGRLGGLIAARLGEVDSAIQDLDRIAGSLIHEVNRLHTTGTNAAGRTDETGTTLVIPAARSLAMNDPANTTFRSLDHPPVHGGFLVQIRTADGAHESEHRIGVDLDGINAAGLSGTEDDTSLATLAASLDAVPGISASILADGRLRVTADEGYSFAFAEDSSGVLASLGVGTFFAGRDAASIAIAPQLKLDPSRVVLGRQTADGLDQNGTAKLVSALRDTAVGSLGNRTIGGAWDDVVQRISNRTSRAELDAESTTVVRESLDAQHQAISGVSIDEESINLVAFQAMFRGSSRVIATADELLSTLIALV